MLRSAKCGSHWDGSAISSILLKKQKLKKIKKLNIKQGLGATRASGYMVELS